MTDRRKAWPGFGARRGLRQLIPARPRVPWFAMKEMDHDGPAESVARVRGPQWPAPADTRPAAPRRPGRADADPEHRRAHPASRSTGREPGLAAVAAVQRHRRPPGGV